MAILENSIPKFSIQHPITKQTLWFRPFLVKEEKKMLTVQEFGSKEELINCAKEIVEECYDNIRSSNLSTFELDYLFNQIRIKSIGETVRAKFVCPFTGEQIDLNFDLNNIKIKGLENFSNKVKINDKIILNFRCPSYSDISEIGEKQIDYDYLIDLSVKCLTKITTESEVIDMDHSKHEQIKDMILNLTTKNLII